MSYHLGSVDPNQRAELFGDARDDEPPRRPRRVLATVLALGIMGLFSGGLWFAYVQGKHHAGSDAASGDVPLIRADERPTKVKPDQPGGMEIPDRDKLIYNPTRKVVEHLLAPAEKPMPRPAPSLSQTDAARSSTGAMPPASSTPENPPAVSQMAQPQQQAAASPSKAAQAPSSPSKPAAGARLQLGSLRSEDAARQEWERIKRKNSDLLGSLSATPVRADLGDKGIYYRIQAGPIADPAAAERICGELKQRSIGCILAR